MFINPSLSERLSQIIEPLRLAVAAHGGKHRADVPLVVLLWGYLHRVAARFASLTARLEQGRLARPSAPRADPVAPSPRPRPPRLPRRFGLVAQFGWNFRNYGSQLRHLLEDPQMRELLEASPQAARILRPLCRMMGIEPAPDLPPALYPERPKPPTPAARTEPPAIDPATEPARSAPPAWNNPLTAWNNPLTA